MAVEGQFFVTSETGPDFPIESLVCAPVSGLTMQFNPGVIRIGATVTTIPSGTVVNADDTTNYAFVNSSGTLTLNDTGYPTGSIPLARVVTSSGSITSITDDRTFLANSETMDVDSVSSEGESQTTSTTFVQKVRLNLTVPSPKKKFSSPDASYPNFAGVSRISLTSGTHTIDMDFRTSNATRTAAIRRARIITIRG